DGYGAAVFFTHFKKSCKPIPDRIAEEIVNHHQTNQEKSNVQQGIPTSCCNHDDDQANPDHRHERHGFIQPARLASEDLIEDQTGPNRDNDHLEDIPHHLHQINLYKLASQHFHQKG